MTMKNYRHMHVADLVTQIASTILFKAAIDFGAGQNRTYYIFQNAASTAFSCGQDFKPVLVADLN